MRAFSHGFFIIVFFFYTRKRMFLSIMNFIDTDFFKNSANSSICPLFNSFSVNLTTIAASAPFFFLYSTHFFILFITLSKSLCPCIFHMCQYLCCQQKLKIHLSSLTKYSNLFIQYVTVSID